MSPRARYVMCGDCEGSGVIDEHGAPSDGAVGYEGNVQCDTCDGRGEVLEGAE